MTDVLIVGCGDLGAKIAQVLQKNGRNVLGVRRSHQLLAGLRCIQADVTKPDTLEPLKVVQPKILIYCVAADAQSDASYRLQYVEGLRNVLQTQQQNQQLQHVFFISSTRVYGQHVDAAMNEETIPLPNDFGGERLLEAEGLLDSLHCGKTVVRLSGIYGDNRLYLLNMVKDPQRWPKQDRWTNRIHRDDAASFLVFLCERVLKGLVVEGCYIGTDGSPVKLSEVLTWLAAKLNTQPPVFPQNAPIVGKRLDNQQLRNSGFKLQYPNYQAGYQAILEHV